MKFVLIVIISAMCVFFGFVFSSKFKKRMKFFNALILLCQKLDLEINYSRERLKILIDGIDENIKRDLLGVDSNFMKILADGSECSSELLFKNLSVIKSSEKEVITMFFKNLGRSNLENQSREIKNYLSRFESLCEQASTDEKKFGKLGLKLGIISALAVFIILI